jgi:hypothetical protein
VEAATDDGGEGEDDVMECNKYHGPLHELQGRWVWWGGIRSCCYWNGGLLLYQKLLNEGEVNAELHLGLGQCGQCVNLLLDLRRDFGGGVDVEAVDWDLIDLLLGGVGVRFVHLAGGVVGGGGSGFDMEALVVVELIHELVDIIFRGDGDGWGGGGVGGDWDVNGEIGDQIGTWHRDRLEDRDGGSNVFM